MNAAQLAKMPQAARAAVRAADKSGALDRGEFTMAVARADVIKRLGLTAKAGDDSSVKKEIKAAAALENEEDEGEEAEPSPAKEEEEEEEEEDDEVEEVEGGEAQAEKQEPAPRNKAAPRRSKPKPKSKAAESESESESEDDDGDDFEPSSDEGPPRKKVRSSTKATSRVAFSAHSQSSTPLKGKDKPPAKSVEKIEDSDEENPLAERKGTEPASPARSESSMSSVYDEPPKKRGRGASAEKPKKSKKVKKDPNEGLSPDEARVADLKRIVVACGVRKQWTKEFADCPTPTSQIDHLRDLLRSLGMKGNPTTGKAKSLKERRELAQELNDVQEFESKRGAGAERPGRGRAEPDRKVSSSGAMAAVMDFLDDDDD
ncbi:uncharacterized protein CcaverHIS019_0304100 [Cutaneotrichosporon cavernicola]|uniref:Histone chaperone domain-containing protein n=1 Tax=Cutaneotrichosporon cavernicola TaxID=279322 RepID=A0AA48I9J5_9TREE|nr:uncharacterized protein CcaverHIS019_0304100 [Cutaneotrichosporon cavernicola]BEI90340.1 hypothetical protein CcaverHIS019_0304100 [Cutaneotrichosporon cavernicola]BEI98116.1 hypothetical protein CcaverHIS631_0304150 [Cutaneotrichosporon cavernicola]